MSELTPQKRMNVKGHLVTKHVRTGPKTAAGAAKIPQPKLPVAKKAEVLDPMSQPVGIKYFSAADSDKAFYKGFAKMIGGDPEMPQEAQITSRVWYAAQRLNLSHCAIFTMAALGYEDADEMAAYVDSLDRRNRRKETPGREMRRHRWVDNLVSEGISYETFKEASANYDGLRPDSLNTPEADNATAADIVRAYAEYPKGKNRTAIIPFIWQGELTFDEVKKHGATRIARHEDAVRRLVTDEPHKMSLDDLMIVIKHEEKSFSPLEKSVTAKVHRRGDAVLRWGLERALKLRMPTGEYEWSKSLAMNGDEDKSFEFVLFHEEVQHQSILRGSISSPECQTKARCDNFASSEEYAGVSSPVFYKPSLEATLPYFEVGLSAEETIAALEDGKSARVFLAKKEGGVQESLADGWL